MSTILSIKHYLLKLFALAETFSKIKLILISNFDLSKSELASQFNFDTYVTECIPSIKSDKNYLKEIILKNLDKLNEQEIRSPQLFISPEEDSIVTKSINNLSYSFNNLNEYIYCIGENLNEFAPYKDETRMLKELEESVANINLNGNNINPRKPNFKEKLIHQINVMPVHIKNLSSQKNFRLTTLQSTKQLTESLSKSQKIILLSSFLATQSPASLDHVIFQNAKRTKIKIRKSKKNLSLKTKNTHSFNINRLVAIYASLASIIDNNTRITNCDLNIELISDINTLINLNLIRYVNTHDYSFLSRKMITNISLDFAKKIAEDFEMRIDDFINLEKFLI